MALLTSGINHVAIVTRDLDRLTSFYADVFGAPVTMDTTEGDLRHAFVEIGPSTALHAFEMAASPHADGSPAMFERGHLDHLALDVATPEAFEELRRRLVAAGATDGTVTDFGSVRTVWFEDPDGMGCEIALWTDGAPLAFADRVLEPYTVG